jgi:hypothetical protein
LLHDHSTHIWLLHWLFLDEINKDVQEWREAWNHHRISLCGETDRSPRDLFLFSVLRDGPRGLDLYQDDVNEAAVSAGSITDILPAHMSEVICEVPDCLLPDGLIDDLLARVNLSDVRDMIGRRLKWQDALQICQTWPNVNGPDG